MPKARPIKERFKEKVIVMPSGCHEWTGCLMPNGYGQVHLNGKTAYAHRVAYEIANGPFQKEAQVMHSCDNRKCVNPAHLSLGTFNQNMADMVDKSRQAHGQKNGQAKLTAEKVRLIRSEVGTQKEISERYGVTRSLISMILSRRIWKYV